MMTANGVIISFLSCKAIQRNAYTRNMDSCACVETVIVIYLILGMASNISAIKTFRMEQLQHAQYLFVLTPMHGHKQSHDLLATPHPPEIAHRPESFFVI